VNRTGWIGRWNGATCEQHKASKILNVMEKVHKIMNGSTQLPDWAAKHCSLNFSHR